MLIFKYLHLCNDIILSLVLICMSRFVTYNKENRKPPVILHIIIFVTNNWWVYLPKPHDQWKCPYLGQQAPHSWNRIINNVFLIIRPMIRMEKIQLTGIIIHFWKLHSQFYIPGVFGSTSTSQSLFFFSSMLCGCSLNRCTVPTLSGTQLTTKFL